MSNIDKFDEYVGRIFVLLYEHFPAPIELSFKADVKRDIADVRRDMEARFDKLGLQMTMHLGLMVAAAVSIIAAILKM